MEKPQNAQIAWIGTSQSTNASYRTLRLFKTTWENPHPEDKLLNLVFHLTNTSASYHLLAITVE